jgi:hypothetical protein
MRKTIGFGGILFSDRLKSSSSFLFWPFSSAMGRLGYATVPGKSRNGSRAFYSSFGEVMMYPEEPKTFFGVGWF